MAGYTWQIGASSVYVPSGALASTDTAVVCTTFTLPSAGSFSLSFSVQYNSSVYCAGCCEPAAFRQAGQGCQSCFSVHHTFTIGAPSCVLTALPETVCVGQPVIFQLNLSPGCLAAAGNYLWNFGDGQAGTTSTPSASHTYAAPGSYTVSVCPIRARTREGASPPPCICRPSFQVQVVAPPQLTLQGPPQMCWDTTAQRFVLGGLQPGDQVVWTLSCSGSPTYTLSPSQDTLTVLDWGGSRLCVLEAEVRRGPCQSRIRRSIPKGSLIATLQGTSPTTCRAADYWVSPLPPATQLRWLLPSGITYTLIGNPSTPMLQVQDWGPYTSRGFLLCAEVLGAAGCRETLCLSLAPCCIDSTARTYTRPITVSQILRDYGPDAFLCQTYYINDTLYVDTSIAWVNCQFFFGPYGLVWIKDDQTLTLETPPASCERCQGRGPTWCRLEPCQKRWKGIYAAGYKARVVIRGVFSPPAALQPVWIIAADTGVAATAPASWDISGALFNKCGVGLYWRAPLSSYTTALQQCKTQKALFLQVDTAFVVQSGRPCPYVDISTRQKWPLRRPPVTQDPSTGRVQATVGIWVVSGDSLALNDSVLIFRGLHYGLVGEASTLAARLNRYERLDPEPCFIKDSLRAALRIQALSLYDKTFPLRCPQPFLCPPGTAICSQGEELHARRHLTVLQSRFDSVHIGIQAWGGTTRYPYVRFPLPLTLISQCRLSYGEIGISLIDIGLLDPLHLRLSRIQISQNTLTAYRRGIEILRSHDMEGTLQQNILTAPSRAPLQGIWISERVVSLGPQKTPPKLLLQANQILGYREGVLASSSQGDIEMRQNSIQVAPLPGASGVNIPYPTGFSYLLCSNTLSALAPFALPNPCLPQNPAAVRALAFSLTRLNLYCNTSSLLPWGYHFSGPLPTPHDLRRNVLNHPYLHFFNENSNAPLQVGDPLQASSSIYLPIPLQVSTGGLVQIHERPPVQLVPVCAPGGGGGSAVRPSPPCFGVRGLCERVVPPPPPPPFPGVAARLQHPYPRWAAFRSLLSTPDSLWTNDPAWQSFFTAEQSTPAGQLEIAYQAWRAGDPLALPLSQSLPASPPTETAFQEALSYLEKAERNSLLPAEVERLWELAGSCPDSVGPAAFLAREILRWLGADTSFVEEPCPDTPYRLLPPTDTLPEEREREAERPYLFDRVAEPLILHPTPSSPNPLDTTPPTPTPMYLHILPNPAEYSVTLYYGELPHPESSLEIYDSQGRRLYQKSLTGREGYEKLNVVHWPRGLYQVLLRSGKTIRKETLWIYP
uniref:PKD domain-containing protein n=1 Tax=uncultured Bacteroidota bacterium TaxID=152509 RepID=H5SMA9_9BACT|nr:hypothetical protein HGMM_F50B04C21 [uncultured Bacteroidetes bacterium]